MGTTDHHGGVRFLKAKNSDIESGLQPIEGSQILGFEGGPRRIVRYFDPTAVDNVIDVYRLVPRDNAADGS